ncbi:MAG: prenyltransferase/squalene oxidase repeat-containing protein [Verrucomicrobiota bacterium]
MVFEIHPENEALRAALAIATDSLLNELGPEGHWSGELSSSALSTATAVIALCTANRCPELVQRGLRWLAGHVNADGGWGDTVQSKTNISTTALCWAAFGTARADADFPEVINGAAAWLERAAGGSDGTLLAAAIEKRYGKDRTFSVPILMTLALSGRLGADGWRHVIPLPFELAALPHQVFGALQLPVVSYALPALIAIGQVIHHHAPSRNALLRSIRNLARARTLRVLTAIQPSNGGFLEATPLTSFVTMSLAAMGLCEHLVVRRGVEFLSQSIRPDGSWPIDTNLATWNTTLSIKALSHQSTWAPAEVWLSLREWLLAQQYQVEHPFTHAAPGGWGWTDLPGGVPDADDTAGALIALSNLGIIDSDTRRAGIRGIEWLLGLQNRDGGIPTFCRGWGALPFDRSSPDLTAHALRAWSGWLPQFSEELATRTERAIHRALRFLARTQNGDGSWLPLWFGNEHAPDDANFTYGTTHVLIALRELEERGFQIPGNMTDKAAAWLVAAQDFSGGWSGFAGGPPSVEETALAVEALAGYRADAAGAGARWLIKKIEDGSWNAPSPIGFYFAKLWYSERLYPRIFTVAALGRLAALRPAESLRPDGNTIGRSFP